MLPPFLRHIHRSYDQALVFGFCAGIAARYGVSRWAVRFAMALLIMLSGFFPGFILYLATIFISARDTMEIRRLADLPSPAPSAGEVAGSRRLPVNSVGARLDALDRLHRAAVLRDEDYDRRRRALMAEFDLKDQLDPVELALEDGRLSYVDYRLKRQELTRRRA